MPWRIQDAEENLRQALRQAGGGLVDRGGPAG
jgi:hypothetical protein